MDPPIRTDLLLKQDRATLDEIIHLPEKNRLLNFGSKSVLKSWVKKHLDELGPLFQRVFNIYIRLDDKTERLDLKNKIKSCSQSIEILKTCFTKKNSKQKNEIIVKKIDLIQEYILSNIEKQNIPRSIQNSEAFKLQTTDEFYKRLNFLESSIEEIPETGVTYSEEGVKYYIDRINQFLVLEQGKLAEFEVTFLTGIKEALENIMQINFSDAKHISTPVALEERKNLLSRGSSKEVAIEQAIKKSKKDEMGKLLKEFDSKSPLYQSAIGIPILFLWQYKRKEKKGERAHIFCINLCKEKDGTYTAVQANAAAFRLGGDKKKTCPIVEFKGLSYDEAFDFFLNACEKIENENDDMEIVKQKYDQLFEKISSKRSSLIVPQRKIQTMWNCGTRSLKEWMIFCFQKVEMIELANKFFEYVDYRKTKGHDFDPILPLSKNQSK